MLYITIPDEQVSRVWNKLKEANAAFSVKFNVATDYSVFSKEEFNLHLKFSQLLYSV